MQKVEKLKTNLSTTSISKQNRLSIESVLLLMHDLSLNISGGLRTSPFFRKKKDTQRELIQHCKVLWKCITWKYISHKKTTYCIRKDIRMFYLFASRFDFRAAHGKHLSLFVIRTVVSAPRESQRTFNRQLTVFNKRSTNDLQLFAYVKNMY